MYSLLFVFYCIISNNCLQLKNTASLAGVVGDFPKTVLLPLFVTVFLSIFPASQQPIGTGVHCVNAYRCHFLLPLLEVTVQALQAAHSRRRPCFSTIQRIKVRKVFCDLSSGSPRPLLRAFKETLPCSTTDCA